MDASASIPPSSVAPASRWQTAGNVAKTLYFPVTKSLAKMYEYRKTTAAVAVAILILALCAKYAKTMPMHNFRNGLSVAYHATADFLKNPVHAGLVGGISGAVYLLIGRELVNNEKCQKAIEEAKTGKDDAWGEYLSDKDVFQITETFKDQNQRHWRFKGIQGPHASTSHGKDFGMNWNSPKK